MSYQDFFKRGLTRKEFILGVARSMAGVGFGSFLLDSLARPKAFALPVLLKYEARYYQKIDEATVQCRLCPRQCTLTEGQRSFCRVREPRQGKLYTLVYGLACAVHVDPIEKKPLFHFLPRTSAFSIATAGCNFRCKNCQNWSISQSPPEETSNTELPPEEIVRSAQSAGCPTIAYTYTEPVIFYEYMLATARLARGQGLRNMFHSNGSMSAEPLIELCKFLDGANIDLKAFNQEFYTSSCAGYLETVLNTLKILRKEGVWVEITSLVIPGLNDDPQEIHKMSQWIHDNLGEATPVHFSRFWPQYRLTSISPTSVTKLEEARDIAKKVGLQFVYIGNVPGHPAENTCCPGCSKVLIRRAGYTILENAIGASGKCPSCHTTIAGVWA